MGIHKEIRFGPMEINFSKFHSICMKFICKVVLGLTFDEKMLAQLFSQISPL